MIILIVIFGIFILFESLGLLSTWQEHFCLASTYVLVLFGVTVVEFILVTFYGPFLWHSYTIICSVYSLAWSRHSLTEISAI